MLKRAAMFVAMAMFISMVSLTNAHAEARGPKIFGLQVGMPWEEAVQIAREYAAKKDLDVMGRVNSNISIGRFVLGDKNGLFSATDVCMELANYINYEEFTPVLMRMKIRSSVFNIKFFEEEKLQIICNKYGIPFDKMTSYQGPFGKEWRYKNNNAGYQILINLVEINVEAIEKISDMIME